MREGNPWEPKYRVGAFSHLDEIYSTRKISRARVPWEFKRSTVEVRWRFQERHSSLIDYMLRNPVTGLLIARGDQILFAHYQYGRTDHDRLLSQSMVKSITGMLSGIAIANGAIKDKVWHPIGAEADATWLVDAEGIEVAHFGFSAVLRDYARLGRLLAYDGTWDGKQLLPSQWMLEATTVRSLDAYLAPGNAMPNFGYGYLLWLLPGTRRQSALVGANGQRMCIDPDSKLVMVHTALDDPGGEVWLLWSAIVEQLG